jgi:hypothetical protein
MDGPGCDPTTLYRVGVLADMSMPTGSPKPLHRPAAGQLPASGKSEASRDSPYGLSLKVHPEIDNNAAHSNLRSVEQVQQDGLVSDP